MVQQQIDPVTRNVDYGGLRMLQNGTVLDEPTMLSDVMPFLGLESNATVENVMTTQNICRVMNTCKLKYWAINWCDICMQT
jgi:hypothetical protein